MKFPKSKNRYCPFCKKHTEHKVSQTKKGQTSSMSFGAKQRMRKRGRARGKGNLGKLSKGALSGWKRYGKKSSKKTDLRYECSVCKKSHAQKKGFRAKRIEWK